MQEKEVDEYFVGRAVYFGQTNNGTRNDLHLIRTTLHDLQVMLGRVVGKMRCALALNVRQIFRAVVGRLATFQSPGCEAL